MNTNTNLPVQTSSFVGRKRETTEIMELFDNNDCRLVTLVGLGGIGKTRLAIDLGHASLSRFKNGVCFVNLQPLSSHKNILTTVAQELGIHIQEDSVEQHLADYLSDKQLLLILDNYEHVIEGADLVTGLLNATIHTRFLVTSREPLNLQGEWIYQIHGLPYPQDITNIETYDAVALFVERALQVRNDFVLESDSTAVAKVCRLVEGIPLAIEIATTWLFSLPVAEIAKQIQQNLDFLTTHMRDVPPRHRSMRAVFLHSWQLLNDEERLAFTKLSIFRGGFTREAAQVIANASLHILHNLVQKSLIRSLPNNRYDMHEILRQYAEEQLMGNLEVSEQIRNTHSAYFIILLSTNEALLNSYDQQRIISELERDVDNIRVAWQRATEIANVSLLSRGCHAYYLFFDMQGHYLECRSSIESAIEHLMRIERSASRDFVLAIAHNALVGLYIRLGEFERAQLAIETSLALYEELGRKPPPGFGTEPLTHASLLNVTIGNYDVALQYGEKALERIEATDKMNLMFAHYVLSTSAYSSELYDQARKHAQKAYQFTTELGDDYFTSYIVIVMGNISENQADYEQAQSYYQTSFKLKEKTNEKPGMAFALNNMAQVALLQHNYKQAQKLFKQALELHGEIKDPGGKATTLLGIGETAKAEHNYQVAKASFRESLDIAVEISWTPLILKIITGICDLSIKSDDPHFKISLLTYVLMHSASEPQTRKRAKSLLSQNDTGELHSVEPLDTLESAITLAYELLQVTHQNVPLLDAPVNDNKDPELLTVQETNILKLVANGMTNRQIANELNFTVGTIKWYLHQIYTKLHVSNRTQAVATARKLNVIN